ncbi:DUF2946 family protein [Mesorhizobium sp. NBSH29]|uniref:DUF2946 family protein n=1 Tax=Mesorhizobium sp. NBSH29 TaxID=2654249 RepID=UPI0021560EDF|nr:DUF2946 family protein [Mesorhizobium sp. NBSH29]
MKMRHQESGWFAALRRDRALFALVASFLLVSHLFQPLSQAHAAAGPQGWVICTSYGMEMPTGHGLPEDMADSCPLCLGATSLAFAKLGLPALLPELPSPPARVLASGPTSPQTLPPVPDGPPPAIRAPPFTA